MSRRSLLDSMVCGCIRPSVYCNVILDVQEQSIVNTANLTQQQQTADHAIFADLFDQSPGVTSKSPGRNSFSFDLQDASCDENTAPNIGSPTLLQSHLGSNFDVTRVSPGSQSFTFHGPGLTTGVKSDLVPLQEPLQSAPQPGTQQDSARRRRKSSWGSPTSLPVQHHAHGDMLATFCAATNEVTQRNLLAMLLYDVTMDTSIEQVSKSAGISAPETACFCDGSSAPVPCLLYNCRASVNIA